MDHIGRYQILGELGKGAMGVVYKATDPNIGRTVAVKTLRLDIHGPEAEEMLQRFKHEARAAGVMNHPNIITIYDAGELEGMFYIAMEFIEGQTLAEVLKQEKILPVERVAEIISQTCAGLDYAHKHGIIHRDIKPANIMITADGTAKIMDFGIAKGGGSGMTATGQVVGTPNYMSPEQVKGKPLDGRSDLFSLGVVLYEMLTGERPFAGQNVTTIIYKIVNEMPPAPRDLDSSVHPGLSTVVMKALAKAPDQRYAKGADFARDLQNYKLLGTETSTDIAAAAVVAQAAPIAKAAAAPASAQPASAAAKPAPKPGSLDSTVEAPMARPSPAPPQPARKSVPMAAVIAAVAVVVLAAGAYLMSHRAAPPVQPPPDATASASSAPPAPRKAAGDEKPSLPAATEAKKSSATAGEFGALQISSTPFGAKVTIDGQTDPDWVTPFAARKLTPGTHTVIFNLEGYVPETRNVEVAAGKKRPLIVQMQQGEGALTLSSTPPGAMVYVDGRDTGQVTPAKLTVSTGQHRIALRKEGFKPQITYADVKLGKNFNFAPTLQPVAGSRAAAGQPPAAAGQPTAGSASAPSHSSNPFRKLKRLFGGGGSENGVLEVRTRPKGAEISLDDSKASSHTPTKLAVAPGTYKLTLRLPGYKPITRSITVEKGKTMGVDEVFEPQ